MLCCSEGVVGVVGGFRELYGWKRWGRALGMAALCQHSSCQVSDSQCSSSSTPQKWSSLLLQHQAILTNEERFLGADFLVLTIELLVFGSQIQVSKVLSFK